MKWIYLAVAFCIGSLLPAQGTWAITQWTVPPTYDSNLRNYHDGGWEKLDFHISDRDFNSWGEVQDIGEIGGGGTIQKEKTLSSAMAWTFTPDEMIGKIDPPSPDMIGQGLAQKTDGTMNAAVSLTLHDAPAEGALHGYVEHLLRLDGGTDDVDSLTVEISGATGSTNWGSISFGYDGVTVTVPITTALGESSVPREKSKSEAILQRPVTPANHVARSYTTQHGVFLTADSGWLVAARVEEESDGDIGCNVVLSSKWIVKP